jgi:hypothetical protein
MAGALRLDWMEELCADEAESVDEEDCIGAGKGVFEANIAIVRNVNYAWRLEDRRGEGRYLMLSDGCWDESRIWGLITTGARLASDI